MVRKATITREDALAAGLRRYFTGLRCARRHLCERYVSSGNCVRCTLQVATRSASLRSPTEAEARRAKAREAWHRNKHKYRGKKYKLLDKVIPPMPSACDACGEPPGSRGLCLDHCHTTSMFRGWLCVRCNTGLGLFGDTSAGVSKALAYIQRVEARLASDK